MPQVCWHPVPARIVIKKSIPLCQFVTPFYLLRRENVIINTGGGGGSIYHNPIPLDYDINLPSVRKLGLEVTFSTSNAYITSSSLQQNENQSIQNQ